MLAKQSPLPPSSSTSLFLSFSLILENLGLLKQKAKREESAISVEPNKLLTGTYHHAAKEETDEVQP